MKYFVSLTQIACIQENMEFFKASEDSETWKAYVLYVDDMVVDGCFNAIECSLKFMLQQTDPKTGLAPLFQAQLELNAPDMVFKYVKHSIKKKHMSALINSIPVRSKKRAPRVITAYI